MERAEGLVEALFVLMMLGDDRAVDATYVAGKARWRRDGPAAAALPPC
jgi:guanine deaminase